MCLQNSHTTQGFEEIFLRSSSLNYFEGWRKNAREGRKVESKRNSVNCLKGKFSIWFSVIISWDLINNNNDDNDLAFVVRNYTEHVLARLLIFNIDINCGDFDFTRRDNWKLFATFPCHSREYFACSIPMSDWVQRRQFSFFFSFDRKNFDFEIIK